MKKSLLALAVSLAAASGAHAAWDQGGQVDPFFGSGELLLAVWDSSDSHKVSVAQDLGTQASLFDANMANTGFSLSYTLDASAFSVFATSNASDLHWAVIGINNGAFNTVPNQVFVTTNAANPTPNSSDIGNVVNASVSAAYYVNKSDLDYSTNKATVGSPATNDWLGDNAVFGNQFTAQSFPFLITAGVGESLAFYEFNSPDLTGVADVKAAGQWSIDLASGTLSYAAQTTPTVPVPGAVWLMGSALLGLGSVARRRAA